VRKVDKPLPQHAFAAVVLHSFLLGFLIYSADYYGLFAIINVDNNFTTVISQTFKNRLVYDRTNIIGSRTSFVIESVRSSIQ